MQNEYNGEATDQELENLLDTFGTPGYTYLVEGWEDTVNQLVEQVVQSTNEKDADFLRGYIAALRANISYETVTRMEIQERQEEASGKFDED